MNDIRILQDAKRITSEAERVEDEDSAVNALIVFTVSVAATIGLAFLVAAARQEDATGYVVALVVACVATVMTGRSLLRYCFAA